MNETQVNVADFRTQQTKKDKHTIQVLRQQIKELKKQNSDLLDQRSVLMDQREDLMGRNNALRKRLGLADCFLQGEVEQKTDPAPAKNTEGAFKESQIDEYVREVTHLVCNHNGITPEEALGVKRIHPFPETRQIIWWILSKTTVLSKTKIAKYFSRDHSTVIYGLKTYKRRADVEPKFRERTQMLLSEAENIRSLICREAQDEN